MKKTLLIAISVYAASFCAQADYLMELKDSSENLIESACVKSYSYSNNSASLDSPKIRKVQKYSTEETLTNIIYLDRPVYRRVIPVDGIYN
ncbi:hypothetical protein [Saccharobesus litoralis]|uniref:hypothetical protein n=1 Tax=Saccharobesus litoralis TaxID=2172099 RepID=UPI00131F3A31|nr:hypothetical protein [Saccharobesus litoralis]